MTSLHILAAITGLAVGSFLNVVIHRVPRGESLVRPGSRCARCHTPIRPWQNVPVVSWLLLRGSCAHCGDRISARYPLVELGTAALFVAVTAHFGLTPVLPAYLYLAAIAIALAVIDLDVQRLPNVIVLPSYLFGGLLFVLAAAVQGTWWPVQRGLIAMVALGAAYLAIALLYRGGMGLGDVKLAGLLGLFLGWLGWSQVLVGTFAGFLLGGLVGGVLVALGRANRKTPVPFGPFMLAGALLALFVAAPIGSAYQSLLIPAS
jgi:leader peptidase (prepilin peptidase)/N-methyltransferase